MAAAVVTSMLQPACLLDCFFLFFLNLITATLPGEVPAAVASKHHCCFPSAGCKSGSDSPFGTGSVSLFWSSVGFIFA
jgi:hypothetical protein